tara:strand:+ start:1366 stop:2574 length:1209 start_codon:yes stop_codon:yes gene_type:complete
MNNLTKAIFGGSLILLITMNFFNILNFIFNISMAHLLSLEEYGTLTALISIIVIFAVFSETIQTIVSKYSTNEKNSGRIKGMFKKTIWQASIISLVFFVGFLILSILFSKLLKINYSLFIIISIMVFTSFLLPISRGLMQGKKRFFSLGSNMIIEGSIKLFVAIILVLIGWKIQGALLGIVLGSLGAFFISFFQIKDILHHKEEKVRTPNIRAYSKPVFVFMTSIVLFLSLDIILAKIFFEAETVGVYAVASTMAKIIFIGTQPIGKAMFPFTSERKGKKYSEKSFVDSLLFVGLVSGIFLLFVFFLPNFLISLYSGKNIPEAANILFYLSLSMTFLSFTNIFLLYNLSIEKTRNFGILFLFVALEIILLSIFNENLLEFSLALVASSATFMWGSIILANKK